MQPLSPGGNVLIDFKCCVLLRLCRSTVDVLHTRLVESRGEKHVAFLARHLTLGQVTEQHGNMMHAQTWWAYFTLARAISSP